MHLGLPSELDNTYLPTQPMAPVTLPRNWVPQARITIRSDGCCLFRSLLNQVCGKDTTNGDGVQLHAMVRQLIREQ